ncbi:MAG: hypothetical protein ACREVO_20930 [Steroidobacteraceae bacterium]
MTSWFELFFTRPWLIASHRVARHRRLGMFGAALAPATLVFAPVVLVHAVTRELQAPNGHQAERNPDLACGHADGEPSCR